MAHDRECPGCGELIVRDHTATGDGLVYRTNGYVRLDDPSQRAVIRCPNNKCNRELEVNRGRLRLFTRIRKAVTPVAVELVKLAPAV